jgi:hypothetical protein
MLRKHTQADVFRLQKFFFAHGLLRGGQFAELLIIILRKCGQRSQRHHQNNYFNDIG